MTTTNATVGPRNLLFTPEIKLDRSVENWPPLTVSLALENSVATGGPKWRIPLEDTMIEDLRKTDVVSSSGQRHKLRTPEHRDLCLQNMLLPQPTSVSHS